MPVVSTARMTARQFLVMGEDPPGLRLELVDGEVAVSPSPAPDHSFAIVRLLRILGQHIDANGLGELYQDVDTILDQYNIRRPDILFFSKSRTHLIGDKAMQGPPDLAVEVISPSSIEIDRADKFTQYAAAGVTYYWIVDPHQKTVEGWQLRDGRYEPTGHGQASGTLRLAPFGDLDIPIERLWRN